MNTVVRVVVMGELFPRDFHIFFAQFFNLPNFPVFFSTYYHIGEI